MIFLGCCESTPPSTRARAQQCRCAQGCGPNLWISRTDSSVFLARKATDSPRIRAGSQRSADRPPVRGPRCWPVLCRVLGTRLLGEGGDESGDLFGCGIALGDAYRRLVLFRHPPDCSSPARAPSGPRESSALWSPDRRPGSDQVSRVGSGRGLGNLIHLARNDQVTKPRLRGQVGHLIVTG